MFQGLDPQLPYDVIHESSLGRSLLMYTVRVYRYLGIQYSHDTKFSYKFIRNLMVELRMKRMRNLLCEETWSKINK